MLRTFSSNDILHKLNFNELVKYLKHEIVNFEDRDFEDIPEKTLILNKDMTKFFITMPALSYKYGLYINKIGSIFVRETGSILPSVHSNIIVFSTNDGKPLAILDGNAITNIKCGAISALVTDYCSKPNSSVLTIIGTGVQARQQILGVCSVRDIKEIFIVGRNTDNLKKIIDEVKQDKRYTNITVKAENNIEEALSKADIIGTTTTSFRPLGKFNNLKSSVHINCMGNHTKDSREIPKCILEASSLIVEHIPTAIKEAGNIHSVATEVKNLKNLDKGILYSNRTIFSSTGHAFLDIIVVSFLKKILSLENL